MTDSRPDYRRVFLTFLRNSLIRDMTFRWNFIIQSLSSMSWAVMNIGFYLLLYQFTDEIGAGTGWFKYEFFVFLATTWLINSLVQTFFMPNAEQFSELIRTGELDFALVKPIDTQFIVSLQRVDWSSLSNLLVALLLLAYSLWHLTGRPVDPLHLSWTAVFLYPFYILCGVAILYSLMFSLAATSIWLGRNQTLYDFWFYITNFSRYPMEIYNNSWGKPLLYFFTFLIPVLVVVNVPARLLAEPLQPRRPWEWHLTMYAFLATVISLIVSRYIFRRSLRAYRSASS